MQGPGLLGYGTDFEAMSSMLSSLFSQFSHYKPWVRDPLRIRKCAKEEQQATMEVWHETRPGQPYPMEVREF